MAISRYDYFNISSRFLIMNDCEIKTRERSDDLVSRE